MSGNESRLRLGIDGTLTLPVDVVTQVCLLLAMRGAGKTHTASVLVEEMVDVGAQVVVLDPLGAWYGLRSAADGRSPGLPFVVLGGDHGDLPLEPTAGRLLADLIVDEPVLVVLDLSGFERLQDQWQFVTDFCRQLFHRNRQPLHLVLEEADQFAPQTPERGQRTMLNAVERLVRLGRGRGIGVTLISQRSAQLSKGVLTQASVLIAHRTPGPHDQRAIGEWISKKGVDDRRSDVLGTLASLPTGTAWVWAPERDLLVQARMRPRHTFDSSATPKLGVARAEPIAFAAVDLEALRQRMGEAIEQATADDPEVLRARIRDLERRLSVAEARRPEPVTVTEVVEIVPPELAELAQQLRRAVTAGSGQLAGLSDALSTLAELATAVDHIATPSPAIARSSTSPPGTSPQGRRRDVEPARRATPADAGDVVLKAGARRLLEVIARHYPMRLTKAQIGTLTGFKITGGTFQTYFSTLKRAGYIAEDHDKTITATPEGLAAAGVTEPAPLSPAEVLDMWRSRLKRGARDMLDLLVDTHPGSLTRSQLATALGMAETGGTFQTYVSTLRRNGLVKVTGDHVRATDTLVSGAA